MITARHTTLLFALAATLTLPAVSVAEDVTPSTPAAAAEPNTPAPMGGMGMQMRHGMGHGGMGGEHCPMRKGGMQGGDAPCMMGSHKGCRMGDGDLDDKRLDMLEKRMDMMQMMLETLMKQQRPAPRVR